MCGRVNVWNWTSELLSCNQHRLVVNLGTDRAKQKCHVLNPPVNKEPRDRVSGWLCSALLRIDCLDWETEGLGSGEEMCPKSQCPWMEEGCLEGGWCGSWKRGQILEIRDTNTRGCPVGFARHRGRQWLATASHGGAETTISPSPISLWGRAVRTYARPQCLGSTCTSTTGNGWAAGRRPTGWLGLSGLRGPRWRSGGPAALTPVGGKHICLPAGRGLSCQRSPTGGLVCLQASSKSQYPDWQQAGVSLAPTPGSHPFCPAPTTQSSCKPVAAGQWASAASRCPSTYGLMLL